MSRLNNNISKNSPDNATQNFAERDGRECKKLVEAYRDWLLAYEDLLLAYGAITFSLWSPKRPITSRRGG